MEPVCFKSLLPGVITEGADSWAIQRFVLDKRQGDSEVAGMEKERYLLFAESSTFVEPINPFS
jgi:hypothetical protein